MDGLHWGPFLKFEKSPGGFCSVVMEFYSALFTTYDDDLRVKLRSSVGNKVSLLGTNDESIHALGTNDEANIIGISASNVAAQNEYIANAMAENAIDEEQVNNQNDNDKGDNNSLNFCSDYTDDVLILVEG
jgi:hypothetical protein